MTKINTYVTRGKILESTHQSKCIIKDYNFKTIFSTNDDECFVYPRSSIKIFQALPMIKAKAFKKYKLTNKQIAISCASHCGETEHIKVLEEWLKKINKTQKILKCGVHNPLDKASSNKLLLSGIKPNQLHNNCAGKHLGMITGCLANKLRTDNYLEMNHPYQKLIRECLEYFTNTKIKNVQKGVDGCSAPQYAFTMNSLSISMINLLKNYSENKKYTVEINFLLKAIMKYPNLTGSKSIYPSQLISATDGKMFAKGGAEGILLFAHTGKKVGGIIKINDGNERALPSIANEIFKKLNILNKKELNILSKWSDEIILNHAGEKVGKIHTQIK